MRTFFICGFILFTTFAEAQNKRPYRLQRTFANQRDDCLMPIFEIEDAVDFCDSAKNTASITEIKRLLTKAKSSWDYFELYNDECSCLEKLEDEIFLFSPEDDIDKALNSYSLAEIQKLMKSISYNIEFMWLLAADCE